MSDLENKNILITGATSGIGKAIAKKLDNKKCNLLCIGRDQKRLDELASELSHSTFSGIVCDLTVESQIQKMVKTIADKNISVDIIIHSAGIILKNDLANTTSSEYDMQFNSNVKAPYLLTKAFVGDLIKNKGQLVFINSSVVNKANAGLSLYTASKLAQKGLADCLRAELNPNGIKVFSVFPGQTATPMQAKLYRNENSTYNPERLLQPGDIAKVVVNTLELDATAEITDIYIRPFLKN